MTGSLKTMVFGSLSQNASKLHRLFVETYANKYSTHDIFLELPISKIYDTVIKRSGQECDPVIYKRSKRLFLDVYDRTLGVAYEVQGNQHSTLMHKGGYNYSIFLNDRMKRSLLKDLDIRLVYINDASQFGVI